MKKFLEEYNKTSMTDAQKNQSFEHHLIQVPMNYNISTTNMKGNLSINAKTEYLNDRMTTNYVEIKQYTKARGDRLKYKPTSADGLFLTEEDTPKHLPMNSKRREFEDVDGHQVFKEGKDFKLIKQAQANNKNEDSPDQNSDYYQRTAGIINDFERYEAVEIIKEQSKTPVQKKKASDQATKQPQQEKEINLLPKTFLGSMKKVSKFPTPAELALTAEDQIDLKQQNKADISKISIKKYYQDLVSETTLPPHIAKASAGKKIMQKSDRDFQKEVLEKTKRDMQQTKREMNLTEFQQPLTLRDFYHNLQKGKRLADYDQSPTREEIVFDNDKKKEEPSKEKTKEESGIHSKKSKTPNSKSKYNVPSRYLQEKHADPAISPAKSIVKTPVKTSAFNPNTQRDITVESDLRPTLFLKKLPDGKDKKTPQKKVSFEPVIDQGVPVDKENNREIVNGPTKQPQREWKEVPSNKFGDHAVQLPPLSQLIANQDELAAAALILHRHYERRVLNNSYNPLLEISRDSTASKMSRLPKSTTPAKVAHKSRSPSKESFDHQEPKNEIKLSREEKLSLEEYIHMQENLPNELSSMNPFLKNSRAKRETFDRSTMSVDIVVRLLDLLSYFLMAGVQKKSVLEILQHLIKISTGLEYLQKPFPEMHQSCVRAFYTLNTSGEDRGYLRWLRDKSISWIQLIEGRVHTLGRSVPKTGYGSKQSKSELSPERRQSSLKKASRQVEFNTPEKEEDNPDQREDFIQADGKIGEVPYFILKPAASLSTFKERVHMQPLASTSITFKNSVRLLKIVGDTRLALTFEGLSCVYFAELKNLNEIKVLPTSSEVTYITELRLEAIGSTAAREGRLAEDRLLQRHLALCESSGAINICSIFSLNIFARFEAHIRPLVSCFASGKGRALVTADSTTLRLWQASSLKSPTLSQSVLVSTVLATHHSSSRLTCEGFSSDCFVLASGSSAAVLKVVEKIIDICSLECLMYLQAEEGVITALPGHDYLMVHCMNTLFQVDGDGKFGAIYRSKLAEGVAIRISRSMESDDQVTHTFAIQNVSKVLPQESEVEDESLLTADSGSWSIVEITLERSQSREAAAKPLIVDQSCHHGQILFTCKDKDFLLLEKKNKKIVISYQVPADGANLQL